MVWQLQIFSQKSLSNAPIAKSLDDLISPTNHFADHVQVNQFK
jgi:hypothetical protein